MANGAVVALDIYVLLRLAGLDVVEGNALIFGSDSQCRTDVFRAVIDPDGQRLTAPLDDLVQRPDHALGREREVDLDAQALTVEIIQHVQRPELSTLSETEERLAALQTEAAADAGNVVQIPADIGALYRSYVDTLAETLASGDVIGRASDEMHRLIERVVVSWDAAAKLHHLDLQGDLVQLLSSGNDKKPRPFQVRLVR